MFDILLGVSKSSIRSVFTANKYDEEILDDDLKRIIFIRNLIEENLEFVKENYKNIDIASYVSELKKYAIELFINQCLAAIPIEDKNKDDFIIENHKKEGKAFFNFIYSNLRYPE